MDFSFEKLDKAVRRVPDFPKKGILFYDITGILSDGKLFSELVGYIAGLLKDRNLAGIAAIEARGFIFAAAVCDRLSLPFIPVRKKGKLPGKIVSKKYDLEYGSAEIEVHLQDIPVGKEILVMDDLVATGGTLKACCELLQDNGAIVKEIFCIIGLPFLNYNEVLKPFKVTTLVDYENE